MERWRHKLQCTEHECYCADENSPDPICECRCPGWACVCKKQDDEEMASMGRDGRFSLLSTTSQ